MMNLKLDYVYIKYNKCYKLIVINYIYILSLLY